MPKVGALGTLGGLGGLIFTSSLVIAPVALLLGLALAIPTGLVLGLGRLFSDSWQKKLAIQIVKEFEKVNFREEYLKGIKTYWQQTATAFDTATAEVEKQWQDRIADIREKVTNHDDEKLAQNRQALHNLSEFFTNMPV